MAVKRNMCLFLCEWNPSINLFIVFFEFVNLRECGPLYLSNKFK